jgi:O-antigen ligase
MIRWCGPFETSNIAAMAMVSAALPLLASLDVAERAGWRWYVIVARVSALAATVLVAATGSRAGALALVAGLVLLRIRCALSNRALASAIAVLVVAALSLSLGPRTAASVGDASITHRLDLWRATLALVNDHPWTGVGPGRCMRVIE